jgi:2-polyprenyl-3-methyl-5-hydroxy-6-metoxy-1,4-benzoquinol methylase
VTDRVDFEVRDMTIVSANGPAYDFVTFFECVHDLARPVDALRAARASLRPGGTVLVMDENIADALETPADEVQRVFAAASVVWCTPQGRVDETSEVVGAVIRPAKLRELAQLAGSRASRFSR